MKTPLQVRVQTYDFSLENLGIPLIPQFHFQAGGRMGPLDLTAEVESGPEMLALNVSVEDIPDSDTASDANHQRVADAVAVYKDHPHTRYVPVRSTAKPSKEQKGTWRKGRGSRYLH